MEIVLLVGARLMGGEWFDNNIILIAAIGLMIALAGLAVGKNSIHDLWNKSGAKSPKAWLGTDDASRIFRDRVDSKGELAGILNLDEDGNSYFLNYMREGVNHGIVRVRGSLKNGSKITDLPVPILMDSIEGHVSGI